MSKKYDRKKFLKLSLLANAGLLITPSLSKFVAESSDDYLPGPFFSKNVLLLTNKDKKYHDLRRGFNKRIDRYPAIIALCKNTAGVVEAIRYARDHKLPVAVKSGGHGMEGFSSNDGGMVINLSLLNSTEWVDNGRVKVGPACTLSKLYTNILPRQRIIPGGSCASVGVGGLTLGGGYGILSRKFGLTCDSLLEVTMVDGRGNIVNSKDDEELIWACRGGGNGNFGVITEMIFRTSPAPGSLHTTKFNAFLVSAERAVSILKIWFQEAPKLPSSCFSSFILNEDNILILLTNAETETDEVKKFINSIASVMDKKTGTDPVELGQAFESFYGEKFPVYFKNASAGLYKNYHDVEHCIKQAFEKIIQTPGMLYQLNTLGGEIQSPGFSNASSFSHRQYLFVSELQTYWKKASEGPKLMNQFEEVQGIFTKNGVSAQYCNYPDIKFQNWESLYYGANYARLQKVKDRYDPENQIRHDQSIRNSKRAHHR